MKTLIVLIFYAFVSGILGLIVCGLLFRSKKTKAAMIAATLLFGGPVIAFIGTWISASVDSSNYQADIIHVQELCSKYGGDKIYKTVDNVEGVFQMKARNPESDKELRDQFGMVDPWGRRQGDSDIDDYLLSGQRLSSNAGYIFVENQPSHLQDGPPYRRFYLKPTGKKIGDKYPWAKNPENPELEIVEMQTTKLASRYAYFIEDLTTREMREHWIGGGRIKIIDLQTKDVLAQRTGYFRATGPEVQLAWTAGYSCDINSDLRKFLHQVLKPVAY